jgi:hypothetical protein
VVVQEHAKKVDKKLGKVNLWYVMVDWKILEIDIELCLMKSGVKLVVSVKES